MTDQTEKPAKTDAVEPEAKATREKTKNPPMDPVRKWTLIVLGLCVLLFAWYLVSDRVTPYTTQARVHALVVPIASEVSGTVIEVAVGTNQYVKAGDVLFRIDPSRYDLAVETAEATLQTARKATGASSANVDVARASVGSAEANLWRAEQDTIRLRRIKEEDPGAISDRRLQASEATLLVAQSQVAAAEAGLEMAIQQLGRSGDDNSQILQAQAALDQADRIPRIDLAEIVLGEIRLYPYIVYGDKCHVRSTRLGKVSAIHPNITDQAVIRGYDNRVGEIQFGLVEGGLGLKNL
jgi:multidrug resistance efflux pump